jgi:superfamily II DNA or RNA helicase
MNNIVMLTKLNENYIKLTCVDRSVLRQIKDHFSFFVDGAQYSPRYQAGIWDGKISFFDGRAQTLPFGFWEKLLTFLKDKNIQYTLSNLSPADFFKNSKFNYKSIQQFEDLFMSKTMPFKLRNYQMEAIDKLLQFKKAIGLLCTGSGKSAIIHYIMQLLKFSGESNRTIIIVPNISLVTQLYSNIKDDYCFPDIEAQAYLLYGDTSAKDKKAISNPKGMDRPFLITTWQSVYKKGINFFEQFDAMIIDEVHGVTASGKSLQNISKKCYNAKYKIGVTGTLSDVTIDKMSTIGYVGPKVYTLKSKTLIDLGFLSKIDIKNYIIRYDEPITELGQGLAYASEVKYIEQLEDRNLVMDHIIESIPRNNNILILAKHVKHMKELEEYLTLKYPEFHVHKIDGSVKGTVREDIRIAISTSGDDGDGIELSFGDESICINNNDIVKLTSGEFSKAELLTEDDIIDAEYFEMLYKFKILNKLTSIKAASNVHGNNKHILVASYSTVATGINIPALHDIIFAASYKSKIKILQAIGRGLRKYKYKTNMTLHDMVDDFSVKQGTGRRIHKNTVFKHFEHRKEYYVDQSFDFDDIEIAVDDIKFS